MEGNGPKAYPSVFYYWEQMFGNNKIINLYKQWLNV